MKKKKLIIIISTSIVGVLALAVTIPFIVLGAKTSNIKKDYSYLKNDEHYCSKTEITNLELVKQNISCGYATIEMLSSYYGEKVTEDELSKKNNGGISTSSSDGFLKEVKRSIPKKQFIKKSYLANDTLLKQIHDSLVLQNPVALEWAAKYDNEWTLHFSLISGLDISNDVVTIYNPYGYIEEITVKEFIDRTTFEAYKNMPLFLNFGFAFEAFEKNTIFYAK